MTSLAPADGIRSRVLSGVAWKAVSQTVLQLSRIAVAVIIARLLAPHEFGIAMMVLVVSSLVLIFADLALGAALVQRRELDEADRSTAFWTSVAAGVLFTGLGIGLSWPIAAFYGEPRVQPLLAAVSFSFLITALGSTQAALLTREMNFRGLELRQMAAAVVGAVVGITAAVGGYGAASIIAQQLAIAIVSTTLLWRYSAWRPTSSFSLERLKSLGRFSGNVFGSRLLFYLSRNVDNLLIGRFLGAAALGVYSLAYNIMLVPFAKVAGPLQEVLFPAFSRLQSEPERMASIYLRVNRLVAAISLPAMMGLVVVAPEFVAVVLGPKWAAAVPVIQILAWVGFLQSLVRLNSSVLQARDRTGILLRWALLVTSANVVAFVLGLRWGIVGIAVCYAATNSVLQPVNIWLTGRTIDLTLRRFVSNLAGVAQASAIMVAALLGAKLALLDAGAGPATRLFVLTLLGIVVYGLAALWRERGLVADLRSLRPRSRAA